MVADGASGKVLDWEDAVRQAEHAMIVTAARLAPREGWLSRMFSLES